MSENVIIIYKSSTTIPTSLNAAYAISKSQQENKDHDHPCIMILY